MPIRCPNCQKDDQIQKVSSVLKRQTYRIYAAQTDLAALLKPPEKPGEPSSVWIKAAIPLIAFGLLGGWLGPFLIILSITSTEIASSSYRLAICGTGLAISGLLAFSVVYQIRKHKKAEMEYWSQLPIWKSTMDRWNTLYYCF